MVKYILILVVIIVLGVNAAFAQQSSNSVSCDPYQIGENSFSIDMNALSTPQTAVEATGLQHLGINPQALVQIGTSMSGLNVSTADFANPDAGLIPNEFAFVTNETTVLDLHEGTCTESPVVAELHSGTQVTVLDGPIAAEDMAWWRVRRGDMTGWVVEGADGEIWLQGSN